MSSLDAFNLDDMFAEGGDALFGFDQDLMGGMDDIVDQERQGGNNGSAPLPSSTSLSAMPPGPQTKRTGPRTKRTNPMIPEEENTKKRNKRKSKAQQLDEDLELIVGDGPRKKRKASMKNKGGKAELDGGTKTKKKKGSAAQAKQSKAGFIPSVPAVGQFGARATSSKFKKTKKKGASGGEDPTPPMTTLQGASSSIVARPPPKQEPTFCGLQPSKTIFYPFMESVPPEPNLKNKKVYPGFEKISSTFANTMVKPTETLEEEEFTQGLTMESPVFALISETFEAISDKERQNFNDEKKQALLKTIPHMRKYIAKYDRQKVIADVYALLGLLGRQYNFLKTSLDNMQSWCKTEFSPQEYKATYEVKQKGRTTKHQRWKKQVIKVHVTCPGHREPGPLTAILPKSAVIVRAPVVPEPTSATTAPPVTSGSGSGASTAATSTSTSTKKKSKAKPGSTTSSPPAPAAPKTYAECSPQERRSRIAERVTKIVSELQEKHRQAELKQESVSKKPFAVTEDETLSTQRVWDFMEYKGFHKAPSTSLLAMEQLNIRPNKVLLLDPSKIRGSRAPYKKQEHQPQQHLHPQHLQQQMEIARAPLPQHAEEGSATPALGPEAEPTKDATEKKQDHEEDDKIRISSNSLFDRLQSLLVEEDDDENDITEDESGSDDDSSNTGDDESLGFLDEPDEDEGITDPMKAPNLPVVDLSKLSLEERTFIQLSRTGLIGTSLYPKAHLVLSGAEEHSDEHDFSNVIGSMAEDLSEITKKNNARVQFLESAVVGMDLASSKQLEDQQNSLITKCQNLMKRNKEKAKKNSSKKKDDLNLPW